MGFLVKNYLNEMYRVDYSRSAAKFVEKTKKNKSLYHKLQKINVVLETDWKKLEAKKLSGLMSFLYSYRFRNSKVDYRVAFSVESTKVFVWLVETRENFYKQLSRQIK